MKLIIKFIFLLFIFQSFVSLSHGQRCVIDYGTVLNEGSPYVFGAAQPRGLSDMQWDKLEEQGFRFARSQADLTKLVPCDSPQEYVNNHEGCANPDNWNWKEGIYGSNFVKRASSRGMRVCLTIKNAKWNRYAGAPDSEETMPKNLEVWADIVKKIVNHYQGAVSYIEFFNEVDRSPQFLTEGSPYNRKTGYTRVVKRGLEAIKASEYPNTPGGGPASASVGIQPVRWLLSDPGIRKNLGVITFHDFDNPNYPHEAVGFYRRTLLKHQLDIPIVMSSNIPEFERSGGLPGTLYPEPIARKLIGALKDGIEACAFWEVQNKGGMGDPRYWFDGERTVKTAHLIDMMSNVLKLGVGKSKIVRTSVGKFTEVMGAINTKGERVAVFANPQTRYYEIILKNLDLEGEVKIEFYSGDGTNIPSEPLTIHKKTVKEGAVSLDINMAAGSVYGMKVIPVNE